MSASNNAIPVIAIDGPSASGKGTVAERVANQLGYHYLDSGALYRIVAFAAHKSSIEWSDGLALGEMVPTLNIAFENGEIHLNHKNVTEEIRSPAMSNGASQVAIHPEVRNALLALQRHFRQAPGLVADGRDMASVVFTDALLKIYLTASVEERAHRRFKQLSNSHLKADYEEILQDLQKRDERDKTRKSAPLMQVNDAIVLDTDHRNIDEAVHLVLSEYQNISQKRNIQQ